MTKVFAKERRCVMSGDLGNVVRIGSAVYPRSVNVKQVMSAANDVFLGFMGRALRSGDIVLIAVIREVLPQKVREHVSGQKDFIKRVLELLPEDDPLVEDVKQAEAELMGA